MKAAPVLAAFLLAALPAAAQRIPLPPADVSPATLPAGAKEASGTRQPIEQDLPPEIARPGFTHSGVRIVFAQRYLDDPQPTATLGQIDTGSFAVFAPTSGDRLKACHQALDAALGRLAESGQKLGANALIRVGSYETAGYLPAHPAFLCEQTLIAQADAPGAVMRVRLVGSAAKLP